jgi:hypothetical protein
MVVEHARYLVPMEQSPKKDDLLGTVSRYKFSDSTALIEARMKVGVHVPYHKSC